MFIFVQDCISNLFFLNYVIIFIILPAFRLFICNLHPVEQLMHGELFVLAQYGISYDYVPFITISIYSLASDTFFYILY